MSIHHKELLNRDSYSSREYITVIILLVLVITTRVVFNIRVLLTVGFVRNQSEVFVR